MQYLKADVRQRILCAAEQEFKTNGFLEASIRSIADNAGISLGNIYRYFSNKEALFCAVVEPLVDEIGSKIEAEFVTTTDISAIVDKVVDFLLANGEKLSIIQQCNNFYFDGFKKMLTNMTKQVLENLFLGQPLLHKHIKNPQFSTIIASSFLHALSIVIFDDIDIKEKKRNVKELVTFYFARMQDRFEKFE